MADSGPPPDTLSATGVAIRGIVDTGGAIELLCCVPRGQYSPAGPDRSDSARCGEYLPIRPPNTLLKLSDAPELRASPLAAILWAT